MRIFPEGDKAMAVMFIRLSNGSVSILALMHPKQTNGMELDVILN